MHTMCRSHAHLADGQKWGVQSLRFKVSRKADLLSGGPGFDLVFRNRAEKVQEIEGWAKAFRNLEL